MLLYNLMLETEFRVTQKFLEKQPVQEEHSDRPLSSCKQELNLPHEKYPPCPKRLEGILITRNRKFGLYK